MYEHNTYDEITATRTTRAIKSGENKCTELTLCPTGQCQCCVSC